MPLRVPSPTLKTGGCEGRLSRSSHTYWISLSMLCIVDGFTGINSAAQLSTVGYSFLVFGHERIYKFLFLFLLLIAQSVAKI